MFFVVFKHFFLLLLSLIANFAVLYTENDEEKEAVATAKDQVQGWHGGE